ncbi:hypothetical protein D210916BOD24_35160 [Alteromonas sp. D210916BOD_24]|uniref:hypothetical protein n=1 Tax=Alteromonas sp. D210916BOD_24 TaxID=3157618 RepID=UPI00399CBF72
MKQQTLITLSALFFSSAVLANGDFEPSKKVCVNVGKEITRVSTEMDAAKSGIQKTWLKRQLRALKQKNNTCSVKGFENSSAELAKI